jgi:hypothetical protein
VIFSTTCVGAVVIVLFMIWALDGFTSLASQGLSGGVLVALILGIVLTTGLGVALMGLVFYSDRSNQDEAVYHASGPEAPDGREAQQEPKPGSTPN